MLEFDANVGVEYITVGRLSPDMMEAYETSPFVKKLLVGQIVCEYGHPKRDHRLTDKQWIERVKSIDHNNVCATVIGLDPIHEKAVLKGFKFYVRPFGPKHDMLKKLIRTGVDVKIGIRGLKPAGGHISQIVTLDILPA